MLRLGRFDEESPIIRSTLYYALLDPTKHQLTSYYSQFGYSFVFRNQLGMGKVDKAVQLLQAFSVDQLLALIDTSTHNGVLLQKMIMYYAHKLDNIELITDLLQYLCKDRIGNKHHCYDIIGHLFQWPYTDLKHGQDLEGLSLSNSVYTVENMRDMERQL